MSIHMPDLHATPDNWFVLKNLDGQYSIWPRFKTLPDGWAVIGEAASKEECLNVIEETWADMRPEPLKRADSEASPTGCAEGVATHAEPTE